MTCVANEGFKHVDKPLEFRTNHFTPSEPPRERCSPLWNVSLLQTLGSSDE